MRGESKTVAHLLTNLANSKSCIKETVMWGEFIKINSNYLSCWTKSVKKYQKFIDHFVVLLFTAFLEEKGSIENLEVGQIDVS